jgi:hypothetical protein
MNCCNFIQIACDFWDDCLSDDCFVKGELAVVGVRCYELDFEVVQNCSALLFACAFVSLRGLRRLGFIILGCDK